MNKKRTLEKRILSVLMTVVMAGSAMPLPVFAEENTTDLKVSELTKEENTIIMRTRTSGLLIRTIRSNLMEWIIPAILHRQKYIWKENGSIS